MRRNHWKSLIAATAPRGTDDPVLAAMLRRRRTDFLPPAQRRAAGYNRPLHIGHGQTNSQPTTVADMLWLLDVRPGQNILDVGAGSGWTTAILGDLVGDTGRVLGVEIIAELAESAAAALAQHDMSWCSIQTADPGVLGVPEQAPFDRILVSAEPAQLPHELVAQLAPAGVMVINVAGRMLRIVSTGDDPNDVDITTHGAYRFVELLT